MSDRLFTKKSTPLRIDKAFNPIGSLYRDFGETIRIYNHSEIKFPIAHNCNSTWEEVLRESSYLWTPPLCLVEHEDEPVIILRISEATCYGAHIFDPQQQRWKLELRIPNKPVNKNVELPLQVGVQIELPLNDGEIFESSVKYFKIKCPSEKFNSCQYVYLPYGQIKANQASQMVVIFYHN